MSPDGSSLFVLGGSDDGDSAGATTISYDLATGSRIWLAHSEGQAIDSTVAPSGAAVYVTARGTGAHCGGIHHLSSIRVGRYSPVDQAIRRPDCPE